MPIWTIRRGIQLKSLPILWQRLVTPEGKTCVRCGGTQDAIVQAMPKLQEVLRPLGMEPVLETREIDDADFKGMPSESNRIWIAGRSFEDWLNASVSKSSCCAACGGADCRTLEIGNETFETIPEQLILKAALLAASQSSSIADGESSDSDTQARDHA
jgi:hypothetical protein